MVETICCGIKGIVMGIALTILRQNLALAESGYFNEYKLTFLLALGIHRAIFLPLWIKDAKMHNMTMMVKQNECPLLLGILKNIKNIL